MLIIFDPTLGYNPFDLLVSRGIYSHKNIIVINKSYLGISN